MVNINVEMIRVELLYHVCGQYDDLMIKIHFAYHLPRMM